jgi:translation initiation factor 2-alpha kinase 4
MRQSRWKEEWEELEVLGRGGFGSVSKARNRIDGRIYAVKRIRLKDVPVPAAGQEPAKRDDNLKLWREVDTLSMLSHRSIVRYYGTWVETTETASAATSEGSSENETDSEDGDEDDEHTADETFTKRGSMSRSMSRSISTRTSASLGLSDPFRHDYGNGGGASVSGRSSFPSMMDIEFVKNDDHSSSGSEDDDDDTDGGVAFEGDSTTPDDDSIGAGVPSPAPARLTRTMYIQMEFVERQTLKEVRLGSN